MNKSSYNVSREHTSLLFMPSGKAYYGVYYLSLSLLCDESEYNKLYTSDHVVNRKASCIEAYLSAQYSRTCIDIYYPLLLQPSFLLLKSVF